MAPPSRQFPSTAHVIVALVISLGLWAIMVFWTLAYLRRLAGGLEPFDLRPFGYDVGEARALLFALSEIGRDYYANVQLTLDTAYPATYALSRGLLLWWLTLPGRVANRAFPLPARSALVALPIITAGFDYLENAGIAAMLAAGPQVDADLVAWASFWTQAKSMVGLVTEVTAMFLLLVAFARWWHRRKSGS